MSKEDPLQKKPPIFRQLILPTKIITGLLLALLLFLIAVPHGLKIGLSRWLHDAGVGKAEIEDVDFNPFLGRVVLKAVQLSNLERVGLEAGEMVLTFDWWPLWSGRFKVKNLSIENGSIAFRHLPTGTWRIGGIPLIASPASPDSGDSVETTDSSWGFGAENITIRNMVVRFYGWHWQEECTLINAQLENLATWEKDGIGNFAVRISKGLGTFDFTGDIKPFATEAILQAKLELQRFPLSVMAPLLAGDGTANLEGLGAVELAMKATYNHSQKTFHYESSDTLRLSGAAYQSAAAQLQAMDLRWQGKSRGDIGLAEDRFVILLDGSLSGNPLALHLPASSYQILADQLALQGEVRVSHSGQKEDKVVTTYKANGSAEKVQIHDPAKGLDIVALSRLRVKALEGGNGSFAIHKVEGKGLALLQRDKGKELPLSQQQYMVVVNDVALENLAIAEQGFVSIDTVLLKDGQGFLVRNSQGHMEFSQGQAGTPAVAQGQEKGGGLRIGSLSLTGKNRIVFEDYFPKEPFKETFDPLALEVGLFDSRQPLLKTPLSLECGVGTYASLALTGTISPFAKATTMDLKGTLSSLDLPSLNPYADQYLFYRMESGQLDADIVLKVDDGVMDSEANLLLEKLKIKKVREGEDRFQAITGLPFQYTVDLLRDKKDDIRFRLPVKGDMRSPDFQLDDVVAKALAAAAKKAVISYFTPLGVTLLTGVTLPVGSIYVSGKIVDWATLLRFKPVIFVSGSAELSEENLLYLDSIVKLLGDRPKVRVLLCGKAGVAELGNGGSASEKPESEKGGDIPPQQKTILLELAGSRARQVKEYLVAHGIEAKRLILCEPGIDPKPGGEPRVEIAI